MSIFDIVIASIVWLVMLFCLTMYCYFLLGGKNIRHKRNINKLRKMRIELLKKSVKVKRYELVK